MARPEVLDRIQSAEREAEEIVESAEDDREERIAEAEREAEEIRESAREAADEHESERLDAAREDIEAEREAILESGAAEREQLESRARENVDDVAEYVVSEFEEHVHA